MFSTFLRLTYTEGLYSKDNEVILVEYRKEGSQVGSCLPVMIDRGVLWAGAVELCSGSFTCNQDNNALGAKRHRCSKRIMLGWPKFVLLSPGVWNK